MKKYRKVVWCGAAIVILAIAHLYLQNKGITLKYEYAKLKVEFQKLYDQNRYYISQVSKKMALDRIEKEAKNMEMEFPKEVVYVR
ncbi:hypothetical protein A2276_00355 [candidate division WOR-1 bacterium RIFOXYA12_FULL_43_27]|uniref:Cell division protein FtsL n=1 Tax=candidate division WOR-1 bacterium RIFOXYC2_FULL_46_14 TaxID=1802587 RepID=A0A1F4U4F0_UNCSA|nr:MAG: hypothetical protein A2276_00355 [candidate division WOR-1 bacterium RIFOXYA12_FULL_43_27]OGC20852.1 MAG: hypothetical protein A2292_07520 [candidate division WOR-1 bacterium RIFOXYB2_FULL_46_45]OGC31410.1 MAG: hypothetical protein A2232_03925 [candidate division WOR-1 bacterium RIFOXYA2_FULL_46_56]OGC39816.1 MAG: hypothetical protein A2438_04760 [candidate division WOR-1 bacterium RIFOXYC2_FULL_46_14]